MLIAPLLVGLVARAIAHTDYPTAKVGAGDKPEALACAYRTFSYLAAQSVGLRWYAAIGGKRFTGNPKQQTITICELVDGDYQMTVFRGNNLIASPLFPQINLTAQQIFDSAL